VGTLKPVNDVVNVTLSPTRLGLREEAIVDAAPFVSTRPRKRRRNKLSALAVTVRS